MSNENEQRRDDEVEGHIRKHGAIDEAGDEVEGHIRKHGANDEPAEEGEDEVEAHLRRHGNVRMDSPSNS